MAHLIYNSILCVINLIALSYGQPLQPQVRIGGTSGTLVVTDGDTYATTAPLYTNINSLNITCGLDPATNNSISRVDLTCPLSSDRSLNFSSLGSSGDFLVRLLGTGQVSCECSVTNTSGVVVGRTSFYLNLTVVPYVPRLKPFVRAGNLTLADGDTLNVNLGLLLNTTVTLSWGVEDGYPQVTNVYLNCNNEVLSDEDTTVTYYFTVDKAWDGVRCVCSADHVTGLYNLTSSFIFNVTYVPTRDPLMLVADQTQTNGSTYVFNSNYSVIEFYCSVNDGNPKVTNVTFTAYFESGPVVLSNNGDYGYYLVSLGGDGVTRFGCTGSHVSGLYSKVTYVLVKYRVSQHAPQMTPDVSYRGAYIDEGGNITATVTRRSPTVNIVCTVFDGYPKASNVSLQCGSFKQVIKNYTGVFTLPDAKNLDGARCVCSGEHVTKLYHKTTSFTLHVQYQSTVTKATANGEAGFVLVQPGTLVTIGCEADGNPKPNLSLYGLRTGDLTFGGPVAVDGITLSRTFTASLATSDIYVCKADNGVDPINFGDQLVEVLVGDAVPTSIQRFTVNDQTTQLTVNEGDLLQFKCDTAGGSRRTSLRGMTSEISLYDKTDTLGSSQINEWRTATCDFYDSFQCRVVSSGNVTAMQINVTVVGCNRVVTAITSSTIRTTTMTSSLTALRVTWNGTVVIHGSEFKVPVRKSIQGKREIREVFYCSGPSQVSKIEFSCTIPGNIWPVSDSVLGSSSSFTLTTNTVDEWIKCTCTAYYWFAGGRTEKVSFQISSQADNKKGLIGMSIALMGSVLTTVLATQFLGDQSWI